MRKKILILAKSNKRRHDGTYGKCVAGLTQDQNKEYRWVRLVADRDGDSVTDAAFPFNPLDIIEADISPCPLRNHIENHTYSNARKISSITIEQLKNMYPLLPHSFFGSTSNTFENGTPTSSLTICIAKDMRIYWEERDGHKRQKADFILGNHPVNGVAMTDPKFYTNKESNEEKTIPVAICVASLPNEPVYHKFIAGIFPFEGTIIGSFNFSKYETDFDKDGYLRHKLSDEMSGFGLVHQYCVQEARYASADVNVDLCFEPSGDTGIRETDVYVIGSLNPKLDRFEKIYAVPFAAICRRDGTFAIVASTTGKGISEPTIKSLLKNKEDFDTSCFVRKMPKN